MPRPFFFVVGLPGVGKSTFASHLGSLSQMGVINSGDALRRYMKRHSIVVTDPLQTGERFLQAFDERAAACAILEEANKKQARIIDGVRLFSALAFFAELGQRVQVVHLSCIEAERRRRFAQRAFAEGEANPATLDDVLRKKDAWSDDALRFRAVADHLFDNSGALPDLGAFALSVSRTL